MYFTGRITRRMNIIETVLLLIQVDKFSTTDGGGVKPPPLPTTSQALLMSIQLHIKHQNVMHNIL